MPVVAAQVAFCFFVHFVAGLFVSTFDRLSNQRTGFSSDRLLVLETVSTGNQLPAYWDQVTERLRSIRGVESAAIWGFALISGNGWDQNIWVNGQAPDGNPNPYFQGGSSGWLHHEDPLPRRSRLSPRRSVSAGCHRQ